MRKKLTGYIQLTRPYAAYLTPIIIILGAICNNEFNLFRLLILFIIGIFVHIAFMIQNDYFDIEVESPYMLLVAQINKDKITSEELYEAFEAHYLKSQNLFLDIEILLRALFQ